MGRKKNLTNEELEFIKVNIMIMSVKEIAEKLGRNYYTIFGVVKKLGISSNHWYTPQEDAFIRKYYGKDGIKVEAIAAKIGVSVDSIYNRAKKIGVNKFTR